jgi:hypothetical protein
MSPVGRTSGTLVNSDSAPLHRFEFSSAVMTSSTPMTFGLVASGLRRGDLVLQKGSEGAYMCGHSFRSEGSSGLSSEGEPRFWNLRGLRPTSPTCTPPWKGTSRNSPNSRRVRGGEQQRHRRGCVLKHDHVLHSIGTNIVTTYLNCHLFQCRMELITLFHS